jgi:hypothetical protein
MSKNGGAKRSSMPFPFPAVGKKCLICAQSRCARWKGYFVRSLTCAALGRSGPIAVHVGHCKTEGRDFSYMPDFLVPGRRLSRPTLRRFVEVFAETGDIKKGIDDIVERIEGDDFSIALSSAYDWLYGCVRALRLNAGRLATSVSEATSAAAIRSASRSALADLFDRHLAFRPLQRMIFWPP